MCKRLISLMCVCALIAALVAPSAAFASTLDTGTDSLGLNQGAPGDENVDRIIVKFQDNTSTYVEKQTLNEFDAEQTEKITSDSYAVETSESVPAEALVELYEQMDVVEYAEPDYKVEMTSVPNDPYYSYQSAALQAMHVVEAWDVTKGDPGVVVAVLDTGAYLSHPDLLGQLLPGYDYVNEDSVPSDDNGHGTMCSGIIAAGINNTEGIAGASDCSILPVKVLGSDGSGYVSDIVEGMKYAVEHGADVISMSFGTTSYSQSLQDAINDAHAAGVILVAASGNSNSAVNYPGANANVIAVGSVTSSLTRVSYSCYGTKLDVVAVGSDVMSTCWSYGESSYAYGSGTSFAAPYAAALSALILSAAPDLTPDEVEAVMKDTATDLGEIGRDDYYGYGCVDYLAALSQFGSNTQTPQDPGGPEDIIEDTVPPVITVLGSREVTVINGKAYIDAGATAYDEVDGDLTDNIIIDNPVDVLTDGVYAVTYTVSDAAGNSAGASRNVTVKTNTKPVVTVNGANPVKVAAGTVYKDAGAVAYDAEDGDITSRIITSGKVNTAKAGTYLITYSAMDSFGAVGTAARTVTVYKNTRPSIRLIGSSRVTQLYGSAYTELGAEAQDANDGILTGRIVTTGSVDTLKAGTYRVVYTVTDSGGLSASVTRTVTVKANSKPTISLIGGRTVTVPLGSTYTDAGATAKDAEDGNLTSSIVRSGTVNTLAKGSYYITYSVADRFGATASVTRTVRVK